MSGQVSNDRHVTNKSALNRLCLLAIVAWALLFAASLEDHKRDHQWGRFQCNSAASCELRADAGLADLPAGSYAKPQF
jgi:hypothetical protein